MAQLYKIFEGDDLNIAEKIQRRRYQMLVHSYIYYELDKNLISDSKWSQWAMELAQLQSTFPEIASKVPFAKDFEDWDGSSGAYLTYRDKPNIVLTAERLVAMFEREQKPAISIPQPKKPLINKSSTPKKKLF